ncbi:tRNA-guanine(15) transglycosylase-like protein [Roridomyces roridus]|uniref:tRNA-guanine(15) transglycosylase-like protein n=1 Tax=Roridomyces roridus TaxID=1738132 RepID=A0AAD7FZD3_9AGAR|nr:tRNA-guanine(15) transglycosylase-like protein [Roridomyces roridus]
MLSFTLAAPCARRPRTGTVRLRGVIEKTPAAMATTSRGVVPHLSRDQYNRAHIPWVHIPFESFLENNPPVPTLQPGPFPLHTFLGFDPDAHILSLSLRDPADGRETPANGAQYVAASTSRGVRRVTVADWRGHVHACKPDIVVAMPDIPWTNPPFSQKRTTKSIERTVSWLAHLLAPDPPLNILVHMAGGVNERARRAFAQSLVEPLDGLEAAAVKPLKCLDDGIIGYTFDLVPLRREIDVEDADKVSALLQSSLEPLPPTKLRVVISVVSPHQILRLIRDVGIDLFDVKWAQDAANVGVSLDFVFPVPQDDSQQGRDLGHNLYRSHYAHDFASLSTAACTCNACAPVVIKNAISHSQLDAHIASAPSGYTRAYIHHLLHTHEMGAHALLVLHNLAVVDKFFDGIRAVLARGDDFTAHVAAFAAQYDESLAIVNEARTMWKEVDVARGKGRIARERD